MSHGTDTVSRGTMLTDRTLFQFVVIGLLFVLLSAFALSIRDLRGVELFSNGPEWSTQQYVEKQLVLTRDFPYAFRVGARTAEIAMNHTIIWLADVLDVDTNRWLPDRLSEEQKISASLQISRYILVLMCLAPIVLYAVTTYRFLWLRSLVVIALFMPILGWARNGDIFQGQFFLLYDYAAVGFLLLLMRFLIRPEPAPLGASVAFLVIGQSIFEHLGFITGVAVALQMYVTATGDKRRRLRAGVQRLVVLGAVSVLIAATVYLASTIKYGAVTWNSSTIGSLWVDYGSENFAALDDVIENFLELIAYPALAGLIVGGLSLASKRTGWLESIPSLRQQARITGFISLGFFIAICVGLFVSGLRFEMGRQVVPFACIFFVLVSHYVMYGGAVYLSRRQADNRTN